MIKIKSIIASIFNLCVSVEFINIALHKVYFYYKYKTLKTKQASVNKLPKLFFGPVPILNNKYWSNALKKAGYESETVMSTYYESICNRNDFDIYFDEVLKKHKPKFPMFIKLGFSKLVLLDYVLDNFDIIHIPFSGLFFQETRFDESEMRLIKKAGIKIVVIPYGSDSYIYSKIMNPTVRHGFLLSYPDASKKEESLEASHVKWVKYADTIITGYFIDGVRRWDVLPFSPLTLDINVWKMKDVFSSLDGINGEVNIIHTPNHRGFKGTDFIINAVEELKKEGLKINLILLEKIQNEEVRRIMRERADILVEQLLIGYALSGLEGMATGLPVITNLENEEYTRLFRRFSFLNECPALSATPENIKQQIKILVRNPELRKNLGISGNQYVKKYHSETSTSYMFGKIYENIWYGKEIDLLNLFNPSKSFSYNNQYLTVNHPLCENKITAELLASLNK